MKQEGLNFTRNMRMIKSGESIMSITEVSLLYHSTRKKFCFFLAIIPRTSPTKKKPCLTKKILIGRIFFCKKK